MKTTNLIGGPGSWGKVIICEKRVPRERVYLAIDSERSYQDYLKKDRTSNPTDGTRSIDHTVGDFVTMLQHYQNELTAAWTQNPGDMSALHTIRKIAGIAVNCMEQHGAPLRKPAPAIDLKFHDTRSIGRVTGSEELDKDEDGLEDEQDWTSFFDCPLDEDELKPGGTG